MEDNKLIDYINCCIDCNKNYQLHFDKDLINRFANTYEICTEDINKFILLLRKGIYTYEHMDKWKNFGETLLPNKEDFYSRLNMVDITNVGYVHTKKVYKEFKINSLDDYHDLYVQSDTLFLADLQMHLKTLDINLLKYMNLILLIFISTWISMASMFKENRNKIRIN